MLQATICTAVKNSLNNKTTNSSNIKYITQTTFISVHAKQKITTVTVRWFQTFIGNQVTCLKILPQQIQAIVELAALHLEKVPEFLDLLNDIVKVSDLGLTLKRNQAYVMKYLMQVTHSVTYLSINYTFVLRCQMQIKVKGKDITLIQRHKEERKGKWTCIAPIVSTSTTLRSDVDHTELPANTPHLQLQAAIAATVYVTG